MNSVQITGSNHYLFHQSLILVLHPYSELSYMSLPDCRKYQSLVRSREINYCYLDLQKVSDWSARNSVSPLSAYLSCWHNHTVLSGPGEYYASINKASTNVITNLNLAFSSTRLRKQTPLLSINILLSIWVRATIITLLLKGLQTSQSPEKFWGKLTTVVSDQEL